MIQFLITRAAWEVFGDRVLAVAPDGLWWTFEGPGSEPVRRAGADLPFDPEVAWLTHDVFRDRTAGAFFDACAAGANLALLQSATASADGPSFLRLRERGVRVATSHVTGIPISEYVLGAVLRHYQRPDRWQAGRADRAWVQHEFREMYGTTWLIVGLGHIGATLAGMVRACGARVIGVRRFPNGDEPVDEVITPDRVPTAVPRADVVVLCAPPSSANFHLVDATFLGRMRPGSVLVNVARGSLVDDQALLAALDSGTPEVAIMDVFDEEPLPSDHPFWGHPRTVVTPHNSGWGDGRYERATGVFLDNIARYRAGQPLRYEVGP